MHEKAEKFEKTWSKISFYYTWLLQLIISSLDNAFMEILDLEASPVVGRQLQQKDKKSR